MESSTVNGGWEGFVRSQISQASTNFWGSCFGLSCYQKGKLEALLLPLSPTAKSLNTDDHSWRDKISSLNKKLGPFPSPLRRLRRTPCDESVQAAPITFSTSHQSPPIQPVMEEGKRRVLAPTKGHKSKINRAGSQKLKVFLMKENDKKLKTLRGAVPLRAPVTQQAGDFIRALGKTVTGKNKSVPCFHPQMN